MAKIPTATINSPNIIVRPQEIDDFFDLFRRRNVIRNLNVAVYPLILPDGNSILIDPETGFSFEQQKNHKQINYTIVTGGVFACLKDSPFYRRNLSLHQYIFMRSRDNPVLPKKWQIHHVNGVHTDNSPRNLVVVPPWLHLLLDKDVRGRIDTRAITVYEYRVLERALDIILKL